MAATTDVLQPNIQAMVDTASGGSINNKNLDGAHELNRHDDEQHLF